MNRGAVTCPKCGHSFHADTMAERGYEAYIHIVSKGMSNKAYGQSRGFASSTVTLYRRLGIALVEVGIDKGSELFATLGQKGNNKHIAAAIEAVGATPESVQSAVDSVSA